MFLEYFVIDGTHALITVEKSGLTFLTFFVNGMHVLINLLIYALFIENIFIGIIGFHLVFS